MPTAAPSACLTPGCPGIAVDRGRCERHRQTTGQRGYGSSWQRISKADRAIAGRCENCGATEDLTDDHRVPRSLGGDDSPGNRRVLCRSCHGKIGQRRNYRGDAGRGGRGDDGQRIGSGLTAAPSRARPHLETSGVARG